MKEVVDPSVRTSFKLGEKIWVPGVGLFKQSGDAPRPEFEKVIRGEEGTPKADPLGTGASHRHARGGHSQSAGAPSGDVRRGVRKPFGDFVDLTEQLDEIEEKAKREAIELVGFIDRRRVPHERIKGAYYVGTSPAPLLFRVLCKAMRVGGRAGIVRWTKRKGETLGVLVPGPRDVLEILELHFAGQMRVPNAECMAHLHVSTGGGEVAAATELMEAMAAKRADLDAFTDYRWQAEHELIARAQAGELDDYVLPAVEVDGELADLESLLAGSLR